MQRNSSGSQGSQGSEGGSAAESHWSAWGGAPTCLGLSRRFLEKVELDTAPKEGFHSPAEGKRGCSRKGNNMSESPEAFQNSGGVVE